MADTDSAPGGAAAVDRALGLLASFKVDDGPLTLSELAARSRLHKSTTLRLLASLEHARLVQRGEDRRYGLGAEVARLHAIYSASFSLEVQLLPLMQRLVAITNESVAFHVRRGDQRLCLLRVDSPQLLRDHVRAGDVLPLDRGAGGRVLLAFSGAKGRLYEQIRRDGLLLRTGDRVKGLTGIAAPVWDASGALVGAMTLTVPETRLRPSFVPALREAAEAATLSLGGRVNSAPPPTLAPRGNRRPGRNRATTDGAKSKAALEGGFL